MRITFVVQRYGADNRLDPETALRRMNRALHILRDLQFEARAAARLSLPST